MTNTELERILQKVTDEFLSMSDEEHRKIRKDSRYDGLFHVIEEMTPSLANSIYDDLLDVVIEERCSTRMFIDMSSTRQVYTIPDRISATTSLSYSTYTSTSIENHDGEYGWAA